MTGTIVGNLLGKISPKKYKVIPQMFFKEFFYQCCIFWFHMNHLKWKKSLSKLILNRNWIFQRLLCQTYLWCWTVTIIEIYLSYCSPDGNTLIVFKKSEVYVCMEIKIRVREITHTQKVEQAANKYDQKWCIFSINMFNNCVPSESWK